MYRSGLISKALAAQGRDSDDEAERKRKTEELKTAEAEKVSLLDRHTELKKQAEEQKLDETEKKLEEEEKLLESVAGRTALMAANEIAKGIEYLEPIKTGWDSVHFSSIRKA